MALPRAENMTALNDSRHLTPTPHSRLTRPDYQTTALWRLLHRDCEFWGPSSISGNDRDQRQTWSGPAVQQGDDSLPVTVEGDNDSGLPTWPDDGLARGGYPLHRRHDVGPVCVRQPIPPFTNQTAHARRALPRHRNNTPGDIEKFYARFCLIEP